MKSNLFLRTVIIQSHSSTADHQPASQPQTKFTQLALDKERETRKGPKKRNVWRSRHHHHHRSSQTEPGPWQRTPLRTIKCGKKRNHLNKVTSSVWFSLTQLGRSMPTDSVVGRLAAISGSLYHTDILHCLWYSLISCNEGKNFSRGLICIQIIS